MISLQHKLDYKGAQPERLNNPFFYEPDALALAAVRQLVDWLYGKPSPFSSQPVDREFREEIDKGKMFGVLCCNQKEVSANHKVVSGNHKPQTSNLKPQIFLAAYSGQVCGRSDWQPFVPAVFDYLQPDGYFKKHEEEIVGINKRLSLTTTSLTPTSLTPTSLTPGPSPNGEGSDYNKLTTNSNHKVQCSKLKVQSKSLKPQINKARLEGETEEEYIRRRQFENAELHRWKVRERERLAAIEAEQRQKEDEVKQLKTLRRQKSDDLQRWLFSHFVMKNGRGEEENLLEINASQKTGRLLPPAGSGECCEPKLLQYAFTHDLQPVSMAMFWWGESPKNEVRHHLHFYPACNSKCKPILKWMLQGVDVAPNPLESKERDAQLAAQVKTLYEDNDICVISKPAGLMSVPGKNGRESVQAIMRKRYPTTESPLIVHRLDMDTSGLLIIAKTMEAYHKLQKQFAAHEVKKRYVAVLEHPKTFTDGKKEGFISLPLRPDLEDRPRQLVDFEHGRQAVTYYKMVSEQRVWLWPQTGRTHQLRVHCAHHMGLDDPIHGDRLYGEDHAERLYLHAEEISFTHPVTGRAMTFTDKAPF